MKKILILAFVALSMVQANAQIVSSRSSMVTRHVTEEPKSYDGWKTFGIEYLPGSFSYDGGSQSFTGLAINYTKAISITQSIPLFLEWGLGGQYSYESEDDETIHYASVKVPINLIYDFQIPNTNINLDPYVGLKFRGNVWGEYKYDDGYDDESYNHFGDEFDWKRFQIGGQIGVKARFNNKFFLGIGYGFDFNEIAKDIKVNEISISAGIVF